jgi:phage FluMu protein Com
MVEAIACPVCRKKIMNISYAGKCSVETKCPRCRQVIKVKRPILGNKKTHPSIKYPL